MFCYLAVLIYLRGGQGKIPKVCAKQKGSKNIFIKQSVVCKKNGQKAPITAKTILRTQVEAFLLIRIILILID